MIKKILGSLLIVLLVCSEIKAASLLNSLQIIKDENPKEYENLDEYMKDKLKILEINGVPPETIETIQKQYEAYKIKTAIKQSEAQNSPSLDLLRKPRNNLLDDRQ